MAKKKLLKKGIKNESSATVDPPMDESPSDPRPKTSPYTSPPVALHIGPERRTYYVPQSLLQNPEWINFDHSWGRNVHLADVDGDTGHVLVHYLYTGAYQTLNDVEYSTTTKEVVEFRRAVLAYIASKTYGLHELRQLAKVEIERFGAELNVFDVIEAIKDDFSKLPGQATWFHRYLELKVQAAFEADHTVFANDEFFDRINDVALTKMLARWVLQLYNNKVSTMINAENPVGVPECTPEAQDLPVEEAPTEECFASDEVPVEDCPIIEEFRAVEERIPVQEVSTLDECNTVDTCCASEDCGPIEAGPCEVDIAEKGPIKEPIGQESFFNEPPPAEEPIDFDFPAPSTEPLEVLPPLTPVIEEEAPKAYWIDPAFLASHKKTTKDMMVIRSKADAIEEECIEEAPPPPCEPEPELEPEAFLPDEKRTCDWSWWAMTANKAPMFSAVNVPLVEESNPETAPPIVEKRRGPKKKKDMKSKKVKKGKTSTVKDTPAPPPPPEPEDEDQLMPEPKLEPEAEDPVEVQQKEEDVYERDDVDIPVDNSHEVPIADPEEPVDAEENICHFRAQHLLEGNRWRSCKQCRALLHQVTIQLARTDLSDEDGYEVVDRVLMK
ncbi:Nn.00g104490.m01.CDS01 [Neocucurbitaria sp. VM-36]